MRVLGSVVLSLVTLAFVPACSHRPNIPEYLVRPQTLCAGDHVTVHLVIDEADHARVEVDPAPLRGVAPAYLSPAGVPLAQDIEYQICDSTEFALTAWNGDAAGACDAGNTRCDAVFASVAVGEAMRRIEIDPCGTSDSGARADFTIAPADYSESFLLAGIVNCGTGTITLNREGRELPPAVAAAGAPFDGFAGEPWLGDWTATQTVWPGQRCPVEGETLVEPAPRPDTICLEFLVRCPASDDCG